MFTTHDLKGDINLVQQDSQPHINNFILFQEQLYDCINPTINVPIWQLSYELLDKSFWLLYIKQEEYTTPIINYWSNSQNIFGPMLQSAHTNK